MSLSRNSCNMLQQKQKQLQWSGKSGNQPQTRMGNNNKHEVSFFFLQQKWQQQRSAKRKQQICTANVSSLHQIKYQLVVVVVLLIVACSSAQQDYVCVRNELVECELATMEKPTIWMRAATVITCVCVLECMYVSGCLVGGNTCM